MNAEPPEFSSLQRTLGQFSPAPLPEYLRHTLESAAPTQCPTERQSPHWRLPRADRILLLFTSTGLLAACLVLALTLWQFTAAPRPTPASPQDLALQKQTLQEIERLIASR